jgi:hypothetical protein
MLRRNPRAASLDLLAPADAVIEWECGAEVRL